MPFSRRRTIQATHRSQKQLQSEKKIFFKFEPDIE